MDRSESKISQGWLVSGLVFFGYGLALLLGLALFCGWPPGRGLCCVGSGRKMIAPTWQANLLAPKALWVGIDVFRGIADTHALVLPPWKLFPNLQNPRHHHPTNTRRPTFSYAILHSTIQYYIFASYSVRKKEAKVIFSDISNRICFWTY